MLIDHLLLEGVKSTSTSGIARRGAKVTSAAAAGRIDLHVKKPSTTVQGFGDHDKPYVQVRFAGGGAHVLESQRSRRGLQQSCHEKRKPGGCFQILLARSIAVNKDRSGDARIETRWDIEHTRASRPRDWERSSDITMRIRSETVARVVNKRKE